MISDDKLNEMLAGLDSVTPGPWLNVPSIDRHEMLRCEVRQVDATPTDKQTWPFRVAQTVPGQFANADQPNFDHLSRCDPDTIRSMIEEIQMHRSKALSTHTAEEEK